MPNVEEIARDIISREGGFVDDPDDPGGATKYGVTIETMRLLGLDLDGDGHVSKKDLRTLTRAQAERIFIEYYFKRPGLAELPAILQASIFDMYVNAGQNAIKILQQLLTRMGFPVVVDGIIGPLTITAAKDAAEAAPDHLADAYGIARRNYYYALADHRMQSRKYARKRDGGKGGWIVRAETFIAPKYHFTAAQHKTRIAAWG